MTNIDTIREALYKLAEDMAIGWSRWTPNEAYKTGFETGVDKALAALSTIEADVKPQEPGEDAEALVKEIYGLNSRRRTSYEEDVSNSAALITAHDDAIRRECAKKARNAILSFGKGDTVSSWYSPMIRKDMAAQIAELVILATEPAREES